MATGFRHIFRRCARSREALKWAKPSTRFAVKCTMRSVPVVAMRTVRIVNSSIFVHIVLVGPIHAPENSPPIHERKFHTLSSSFAVLSNPCQRLHEREKKCRDSCQPVPKANDWRVHRVAARGEEALLGKSFSSPGRRIR